MNQTIQQKHLLHLCLVFLIASVIVTSYVKAAVKIKKTVQSVKIIKNKVKKIQIMVIKVFPVEFVKTHILLSSWHLILIFIIATVRILFVKDVTRNGRKKVKSINVLFVKQGIIQ